jgi:hypothetical protein
LHEFILANQSKFDFYFETNNNYLTFNFFGMTSDKNYQNSGNRHVFRLRDPELHPQKDFDASAKFPPRYPDLNDNQKNDVAEFIDFLNANKEAVANNDHLHFHLRDHDNRPVTTDLEISEKIPTNYSDLSEKEKSHIFEFISFLLKKVES